MKNSAETTIREYVSNVFHMSLATSADNRPWICEVHFVFDDDLNLYWLSKESRRHSQEIARNPHVAGNIVEQHDLSVKPRGVSFEGTAEIVPVDSVQHPVYQLFVDRIGLGPQILADATDTDGHRFYKVTVSDWYLFDARESKPGQKYHLPR